MRTLWSVLRWRRAPPYPDQCTGQRFHFTKSGEEKGKIGSLKSREQTWWLCNNIFLLSNMKIIFFQKIQMILALTTSTYLTSLQGLPALLENKQKTKEKIFTSRLGLLTGQNLFVKVQWECIKKRHPFLLRPSGLSQSFWDLCTQRASSGCSLGRLPKGSQHTHGGRVPAWPFKVAEE